MPLHQFAKKRGKKTKDCELIGHSFVGHICGRGIFKVKLSAVFYMQH